MKKKFIITTVIALLFCVVIVNTMADPSGIAPPNNVSVQQLGATSGSGIYVSLDKAADAQSTEQQTANATTLLSMLMIGLALVGLANFRDNKEEKRTDSQIDRKF